MCVADSPTQHKTSLLPSYFDTYLRKKFESDKMIIFLVYVHLDYLHKLRLKEKSLILIRYNFNLQYNIATD